jgi:acyl-CoA thioesterase I
MQSELSTVTRQHSIILKVPRLAFAAICAVFVAAATIFMPAASHASEPVRLVVLGDSLSAGFELPQDAAYPAQLEAVLKAKGIAVAIQNAGVSGDTTTAGLERVDWSVSDDTKGVILALGANDALRGIDPAIASRNLDEIITRLKARKIAVFLVGMLAPPNNGADYGAAFNAMFPELAKKHDLPLYPFFLDGVMGQPGLQLKDGMHPTREGVAVMAAKTAPLIEAWIATLK